MHRTRPAAAIGLVIGILLGIGAARNTPAADRPNASLDSYVILAGQELRASGLRVLQGNVGVNAGTLIVRGGMSAPLSQVSANAMRFLRPSTCTVGELFGNETDPNPCGTPAPFTGSLLGVSELQQACAFPAQVACTTAGPNAVVDVEPGQVRRLPPGTYGSVNLKAARGIGSILALDGGEYTFCSIRTARSTRITIDAPVTIKVSGDVKIGDDSYLGPASGTRLAAADLRLFVAGERVGLRKRSNVHALVCAPLARLQLNRAARFEGRLVAQQIGADGDVTVGLSGSGGSTTSTTITTTTTTSSSTRLASVCGNNLKETGEDCDPPGALSCPAPGSPTGAFVACSAGCSCPAMTTTTVAPGTTSTTIPAATCGNGVREAGEACDAMDFGGATCPGGAALLRCDACTRIDTSSCPVLTAEVCGNCTDDDGNGLVDFEDPACCAQNRTFTMTLSRGRIVPGSGTSRVRLRGVLARAGLARVDPAAQDVVVQLRPAQGGTGFCARIPAGQFAKRAKGRRFRFKDTDGVVDEARGLRKVVVRVVPDGSVRFVARARQAKLAGTGAGPVRVTVGFRAASTADNRCSTTTQTFRAGRRGALVTP